MKIILSIVLLLFAPFTWSQLQTAGGQTPNQLVQNVLLGSGVDVFNINYSGASGAIGTFNSTNASIGIDEGIIMTTGTINQGADGPHGPNNRANAGMDNGETGYSALTNLVGTTTYNATLLEFDFIPYSDTVKFKYVFASEEYPEFVGSQFNDVFAFFISGPGIPGGSQNMAIIPGTTQPVAINNVNHLQNTNFYQDNGDGSQAPFNNDPFYVQYDGFTVPLEAVSKVQCGETYHLIIAVADVADPIYDSGIFLEKNSLNSLQPVQVSYQLTSDPYGDGQTMAQGCTSAEVTVNRSGPMVNQALTIPISVSGSAVQGLDYSTVPNSISFLPGQTSITFTIDALNNVALAGLANLILQFQIEDPCGNSDFQSIELFIKPVESVSVTLNSPDVFCPGEEVQLTAQAQGGGGGYTYLWNTGEITQSIFVSPLITQSYSVQVTDGCLNETASATVEVEVPEYDPLEISATDDIVEQCPFVPYDLVVEAIGGAGQYTYEWSDPSGNIIGTSPEINVAAPATTIYTVVVTDQCGVSQSTTVTITILSPPLLLSITPYQEICPGDSVLLTINATGGFGNYYYNWPHSSETSQSVWVNPMRTTTYTVIVKDDCQTFQVSASTIVKVVKPDVNFRAVTEPKFIGLPITFQNLTQNGNTYFWDLGNGVTSTMVHPNNTYDTPGTYEITLIGMDNKGCLDSITKTITILEEVYLYIPNTFTPGGNNRYNNYFQASTIGIVELKIEIYNRWGELLFIANDVNFSWDGTYGNGYIQDGTYIWVIEYRTVHDIETKTKTGHINVLR
jgi:gliding motility-associated-like protein